MKRLTRAVLANLLVSSMMLSLCACSNQKETDTARAFCETFCEDVKSGDPDKLLTYLGETDVTSKDLKELISPSGFNSEENAFSSAVKESIRYNVQMLQNPGHGEIIVQGQLKLCGSSENKGKQF